MKYLPPIYEGGEKKIPGVIYSQCRENTISTIAFPCPTPMAFSYPTAHVPSLHH